MRSRRASKKRARSSLSSAVNSSGSGSSRPISPARERFASKHERQDDQRVKEDHRQQREQQRVRAVAADVLAQGDLDRADQDAAIPASNSGRRLPTET